MHPNKSIAAGALNCPVEFPLRDDLLERLSKQLHTPQPLPHFAPPERPAATAWDRLGGAATPPAGTPSAQQRGQPTHVHVDSIDNARMRPTDFPKAQLTDAQARNLPHFNLSGDREVGRQFFKNLVAENRVFQSPVDPTKFVLRGPARELLRVYDQALNLVNERRAGRGEQPLIGGDVHQSVGQPRGLTVAAARDRAELQQEAQRVPSAAFPPGRLASALEQASTAGKPVQQRTVEALLAEYAKPAGLGRPASAAELSTVIASADKLARALPQEHPLRAAVNEKSQQLGRDLAVLAGGRDAASELVSKSISSASGKQRENAAAAVREQLGESFTKPQQQAQQKQPSAGRDFDR